MSFQGGPEIGGIFVRSLLPGGAAEQSGSVLVGGYEYRLSYVD